MITVGIVDACNLCKSRLFNEVVIVIINKMMGTGADSTCTHTRLVKISKP